MATPLSNKVTDLDNSTVIARGGKAVQAGTGAQTLAYTGELGEITYDTTDDRLVAHDGATAGGIPMARESESEIGTPVGAKLRLGAGTGTVAVAGTAVALVNTSSEEGDLNGFTSGNDGILTASFIGTRLCRVEAAVFMNVALGTDNCTIHLYKNGVSVYESSAQAITSGTLLGFILDIMINIASGDTLQIFVENEDTTENLSTTAWSDFNGALAARPELGYLRVMSS
jgi:hypothetical protein